MKIQSFKSGRTRNIYTLCSSLILGIFAFCSVMLLYAGVIEYRNVTKSNLNNYELRTTLTYVATKVRQNDVEDHIKIRTQEDTPVLSILEEVDGETYETAIYYYYGTMYEYYHRLDREFYLENGFKVVNIEDFQFDISDDGLLTLTARNKDNAKETMSVCLNSYAR